MGASVGDFRISGATDLSFEEAVDRLLGLTERAPVDRLTITGLSETREVVFAGGASRTEVAAAFGRDLGTAQRVDLAFRPAFSGTEARVALAVGRGRFTLVDGMLFLDHLIAHGPDPEQGLTELATWLALVASTIECRLLGVALEDLTDETVDPFGQVLMPYLLAILPHAAVEPLRHRFQGTGARVDDQGAYALVWLLAPDAFVAGQAPSASARNEVAALAAGAVPS